MKKSHQIDPVSLFPNNTKAARFWFFLCCGLGILAVIQPLLIVEAMKSRERIIIMDESGTFHVGPLYKFEESAPMHDYLITVATHALLARGPKGADNPPLQKQLFYEKGYDRIEGFYLKEAEHFNNKSIHQKAEIKNIKVLKTSASGVMARVNGQLIRIGSFEGRKFTDVKNFTLQLTLYRNPRMGSNGRLPLIVIDWSIHISGESKESSQQIGGQQP